MTEGLLEKSKLTERAYERHRICWKEAKVFWIVFCWRCTHLFIAVCQAGT